MGQQPVMSADASQQSSLEQRLKSILQQGVDPQAALAMAFGPLETWVMQLGEQRLLLHPGHRQWLVYDRVHDAWQPTGIAPGQGTFVIQGRHLGIQRHPGAEGAHAMHPYDEQIEGRPAPKFCPGCGKPLRAGQRFCNGCGRELVKESEHGHHP